MIVVISNDAFLCTDQLKTFARNDGIELLYAKIAERVNLILKQTKQSPIHQYFEQE